jgi:hypothetical protein
MREAETIPRMMLAISSSAMLKPPSPLILSRSLRKKLFLPIFPLLNGDPMVFRKKQER